MEDLIKCILVDDEPQARKLLKKYIEDAQSFELLAEFSNSSEALENIEKLSPEVLFLDIQMPGKSGFEMLYELQASSNYIIVFTTAYDHYALDAFNVSAIDYLLKPFDKLRFTTAVEKIKKEIQARRAVLNSKLSDEISLKYEKNKEEAITKIDCFTCKHGNKLKIISLKEVLYLEAAGNYTKAHTNDNYYLLGISISELKNKLDNNFIRVHRSFIINKSYIDTIESHFNGEYILCMKNNILIKVSRTYKDEFNDTMGVF